MNTTLEQTKQQTLTIRVVFDGAPFAGKTTAVYALSEAMGSNAVTPEETAGRTVWFDWMSYSAGHYEGRAIRVELVTVPGQEELADRRRHLIEWGDVVVFIADTSETNFAATISAFEQLLNELDPQAEVPVIVVANKRDLEGAIPLDDVRTGLGLGPSDVLVEGIATDGGGIQEAFILAVRAALETSTSRVEKMSADELLAEMKALSVPQTAALAPIDEVADDAVDSKAALASKAPDENVDELVAAALAAAGEFSADAPASLVVDEDLDSVDDVVGVAEDFDSIDEPAVDELDDEQLPSVEADEDVAVDEVVEADEHVAVDEVVDADEDVAVDEVVDADEDVAVDEVVEVDEVVDADEDVAVDEVVDADEDVVVDEVVEAEEDVVVDEVAGLDKAQHEPVADESVADESVADESVADGIDRTPASGPISVAEGTLDAETDKPAMLFDARLNPDGIADGAAVVLLAEHWRLIVGIANGRTELSLADSTEAAVALELATWGLIDGAESADEMNEVTEASHPDLESASFAPIQAEENGHYEEHNEAHNAMGG